MNLTTRRLDAWDPLKELSELQNRFNTIFGRTSLRQGNREEALALADWAPAVDISEDDRRSRKPSRLNESMSETGPCPVSDKTRF